MVTLESQGNDGSTHAGDLETNAYKGWYHGLASGVVIAVLIIVCIGLIVLVAWADSTWSALLYVGGALFTGAAAAWVWISTKSKQPTRTQGTHKEGAGSLMRGGADDKFLWDMSIEDVRDQLENISKLENRLVDLMGKLHGQEGRDLLSKGSPENVEDAIQQMIPLTSTYTAPSKTTARNLPNSTRRVMFDAINTYLSGPGVVRSLIGGKAKWVPDSKFVNLDYLNYVKTESGDFAEPKLLKAEMFYAADKPLSPTRSNAAACAKFIQTLYSDTNPDSRTKAAIALLYAILPVRMAQGTPKEGVAVSELIAKSADAMRTLDVLSDHSEKIAIRLSNMLEKMELDIAGIDATTGQQRIQLSKIGASHVSGGASAAEINKMLFDLHAKRVIVSKTNPALSPYMISDEQNALLQSLESESLMSKYGNAFMELKAKSPVPADANDLDLINSALRTFNTTSQGGLPLIPADKPASNGKPAVKSNKAAIVYYSFLQWKKSPKRNLLVVGDTSAMEKPKGNSLAEPKEPATSSVAKPQSKSKSTPAESKVSKVTAKSAESKPTPAESKVAESKVLESKVVESNVVESNEVETNAVETNVVAVFQPVDWLPASFHDITTKNDTLIGLDALFDASNAFRSDLFYRMNNITMDILLTYPLVKKYRSKYEIALRGADLLQLIVDEVESIGGIVTKANAEALRNELKGDLAAQVAVFDSTINTLRNEIASMGVDELRKTILQLRGSLTVKTSELEELRKTMARDASDLQDLRDSNINLLGNNEELVLEKKALVDANARAIAEKDKEIAQHVKTLESREKSLKDSQDLITSKLDQIAVLDADKRRLESAIRELETKLAASKQETSTAYERSNRFERLNDEKIASLKTIESTLTQACAAKIDVIKANHADVETRLSTELTALKATLADESNELTRVRANYSEARLALDESTTRLAVTSKALSDLESSHRSMSAKLTELMHLDSRIEDKFRALVNIRDKATMDTYYKVYDISKSVKQGDAIMLEELYAMMDQLVELKALDRQTRQMYLTYSGSNGFDIDGLGSSILDLTAGSYSDLTDESSDWEDDGDDFGLNGRFVTDKSSIATKGKRLNISEVADASMSLIKSEISKLADSGPTKASALAASSRSKSTERDLQDKLKRVIEQLEDKEEAERQVSDAEPDSAGKRTLVDILSAKKKEIDLLQRRLDSVNTDLTSSKIAIARAEEELTATQTKYAFESTQLKAKIAELEERLTDAKTDTFNELSAAITNQLSTPSTVKLLEEFSSVLPSSSSKQFTDNFIKWAIGKLSAMATLAASTQSKDEVFMANVQRINADLMDGIERKDRITSQIKSLSTRLTNAHSLFKQVLSSPESQMLSQNMGLQRELTARIQEQRKAKIDLDDTIALHAVELNRAVAEAEAAVRSNIMFELDDVYRIKQAKKLFSDFPNNLSKTGTWTTSNDAVEAIDKSQSTLMTMISPYSLNMIARIRDILPKLQGNDFNLLSELKHLADVGLSEYCQSMGFSNDDLTIKSLLIAIRLVVEQSDHGNLARRELLQEADDWIMELGDEGRSRIGLDVLARQASLPAGASGADVLNEYKRQAEYFKYMLKVVPPSLVFDVVDGKHVVYVMAIDIAVANMHGLMNTLRRWVSEHNDDISTLKTIRKENRQLKTKVESLEMELQKVSESGINDSQAFALGARIKKSTDGFINTILSHIGVPLNDPANEGDTLTRIQKIISLHRSYVADQKDKISTLLHELKKCDAKNKFDESLLSKDNADDMDEQYESDEVMSDDESYDSIGIDDESGNARRQSMHNPNDASNPTTTNDSPAKSSRSRGLLARIREMEQTISVLEEQHMSDTDQAESLLRQFDFYQAKLEAYRQTYGDIDVGMESTELKETSSAIASGTSHVKRLIQFVADVPDENTDTKRAAMRSLLDAQLHLYNLLQIRDGLPSAELSTPKFIQWANREFGGNKLEFKEPSADVIDWGDSTGDSASAPSDVGMGNADMLDKVVGEVQSIKQVISGLKGKADKLISKTNQLDARAICGDLISRMQSMHVKELSDLLLAKDRAYAISLAENIQSAVVPSDVNRFQGLSNSLDSELTRASASSDRAVQDALEKATATFEEIRRLDSQKIKTIAEKVREYNQLLQNTSSARIAKMSAALSNNLYARNMKSEELEVAINEKASILKELKRSKEQNESQLAEINLLTEQLANAQLTPPATSSTPLQQEPTVEEYSAYVLKRMRGDLTTARSMNKTKETYATVASTLAALKLEILSRASLLDQAASDLSAASATSMLKSDNESLRRSDISSAAVANSIGKWKKGVASALELVSVLKTKEADIISSTAAARAGYESIITGINKSVESIQGIPVDGKLQIQGLTSKLADLRNAIVQDISAAASVMGDAGNANESVRNAANTVSIISTALQSANELDTRGDMRDVAAYDVDRIVYALGELSRSTVVSNETVHRIDDFISQMVATSLKNHALAVSSLEKVNATHIASLAMLKSPNAKATKDSLSRIQSLTSNARSELNALMEFAADLQLENSKLMESAGDTQYKLKLKDMSLRVVAIWESLSNILSTQMESVGNVSSHIASLKSSLQNMIAQCAVSTSSADATQLASEERDRLLSNISDVNALLAASELARNDAQMQATKHAEIVRQVHQSLETILSRMSKDFDLQSLQDVLTAGRSNITAIDTRSANVSAKPVANAVDVLSEVSSRLASLNQAAKSTGVGKVALAVDSLRNVTASMLDVLASNTAQNREDAGMSADRVRAYIATRVKSMREELADVFEWSSTFRDKLVRKRVSLARKVFAYQSSIGEALQLIMDVRDDLASNLASIMETKDRLRQVVSDRIQSIESAHVDSKAGYDKLDEIRSNYIEELTNVRAVANKAIASSKKHLETISSMLANDIPSIQSSIQTIRRLTTRSTLNARRCDAIIKSYNETHLTVLAVLNKLPELISQTLQASRRMADSIRQGKASASKLASIASTASILIDYINRKQFSVPNIEELRTSITLLRANQDGYVNHLKSELDRLHGIITSNVANQADGDDAVKAIARNSAKILSEQLTASIIEQGQLRAELASVKAELADSNRQLSRARASALRDVVHASRRALDAPNPPAQREQCVETIRYITEYAPEIYAPEPIVIKVVEPKPTAVVTPYASKPRGKQSRQSSGSSKNVATKNVAEPGSWEDYVSKLDAKKI